MEPIEPSFLGKLRRAERRLNELEAAITEYSDSRPYAFTRPFKGKKNKHTWRLDFTRYPENTDIGLIAGEVIYCVRSALDHLAAALNPPRRRSKVYFPIYFDGVWENPVPGESRDVGEQRRKWATDTKEMKPEAIAILKTLQPPKDIRDTDPTVSFLHALNTLSNKDRHQRLLFIKPVLQNLSLTCWDKDGNRLPGEVLVPGAGEAGYQEGAVAPLPPEVVKVETFGTVSIAVQVGGPKSHIRLPNAFADGIDRTRRLAINPLIPYLWS